MSDQFVIPFNNTVVKEGGGDAVPFPDGWKVLATIMPTAKDGTSITKRPYAKEGENSSITALAVRFRASDGQVGAGRNFFADVPLARNLNSTSDGKYPDGTPAYLMFQFFRALGYDVDQPEGFWLPDDRELMGQEVELELRYEKATGQYKAQNKVKFINKANGVPNNAVLQAAYDRLIAETKAAPAATPQTAVAPGWTPPPTAAVPPVQAATTAPPAVWTPAPVDVAYAESGTSKGF